MHTLNGNTIFRIVISSISLQVVFSYINWKSTSCGNFDETVASFNYCYVKAIKRRVSSMNLQVNLMKPPLKNFRVNVDFQKRANGWKPFLYNFTIDGCNFLGSNRKNPVVNFFYKFSGLATHSNLNHSCPYNHDILFLNHTFMETESTSKTLPIPNGEYGIFTTWISDKQPRIWFNAKLTILNDN